MEGNGSGCKGLEVGRDFTDSYGFEGVRKGLQGLWGFAGTFRSCRGSKSFVGFGKGFKVCMGLRGS